MFFKIIFLGVAVAAALGLASAPRCAWAQTSPTQRRFAQQQLQNAFAQQQSAIQAGVQQTTLLLQQAIRQDISTEPSGFFSPLNFQQQESALQLALQRTVILQQTNLRFGQRLNQSGLLHVQALQGILQTTNSLKNAIEIQNGQLTTDQIQTLYHQQTSLSSLLASPPPTAAAKAGR
jgi:hypothetical protein